MAMPRFLFVVKPQADAFGPDREITRHATDCCSEISIFPFLQITFPMNQRIQFR
jgi:hypothetical protein